MYLTFYVVLVLFVVCCLYCTHCSQEASSLYLQTSSGEVKAGPLKRVAKDLLLCLVGGPTLCVANRKEKAWPQALRAFVTSVSCGQRQHTVQLPFHFVSYCAEILTGEMELTGPHEVEVLLQLSDVARVLLVAVHSTTTSTAAQSSAEYDAATGCDVLATLLGDAMNKLSALRGGCQTGSRDSLVAERALAQLQTRITTLLVQCPTAVPVCVSAWGLLPLLPLPSSPATSPSPAPLCLPGLAVLFEVTPAPESWRQGVLLWALSLILSGGTPPSSSSSSSATINITAVQGKAALTASSATGALVCLREVIGCVTEAAGGVQAWSELQGLLIRQLKKSPETSSVLVAIGMWCLQHASLSLSLPLTLSVSVSTTPLASST